MKRTKAIKVAYYGMLVALAFIFSYIESLIPFRFPVPGVKLGLANIVVLVALYLFGARDAFIISCIRIILSGFTFGNPFSMLYSLSGGLLSWLVMCLCKRVKSFSTIGVSVLGGVAHNIGQIVMAGFVLWTTAVIGYLPMLLISGVITGVLTGLLGHIIVVTQPKNNLN